MKKVLFGIAILAVAVMANAQRQGGFGMFGGQGGGNNPAMLLNRSDVKKDLEITDDQETKLSGIIGQDAMRARMMKTFQDSGLSRDDFGTEEGRKKMQAIMEKSQADLKKEIDAVLTPAQSKRLGEIAIQLSGNRAVLQKDVAKAISLTEEQNKKIADLQKAQGEAMQGLMQKMRDGELQREDMMEKVNKNNEIFDAEIGKILTDAQKAKLKEMGGKAFEKKDDN